MSLDKWLRQATKTLKEAGIGSARLDCLILLEDELGRDRAWILAHEEEPIKAEQIRRLDKKLIRRANNEPLAYIRGFTEFYGRKFKVNKRVLEPRPESEVMIELLKELKLPKKAKIADIGTGSGALGITAALELHNAQVDLYDIDANCLAVARHNSHMHELHLHCYKRDLLNRPVRPYNILLANLPYIPSHWSIHRSIHMEPRIAFMGGKEGVEVYRRLFEQIRKLPWQPQYVFTEALPPQHVKLAGIARDAGYQILKNQDLIQLFELRD